MEMISRTIKVRTTRGNHYSFVLNDLIPFSSLPQHILRSQMRSIRSPNPEDYNDVLIRHCNLVLGSSVDSDRYSCFVYCQWTIAYSYCSKLLCLGIGNGRLKFTLWWNIPHISFRTKKRQLTMIYVSTFYQSLHFLLHCKSISEWCFTTLYRNDFKKTPLSLSNTHPFLPR